MRKSTSTALNRHVGPGDIALRIDPVDGKLLIQALSGRWYYPQDRLGNVSKDQPKKPNHPWEDFGDAFCYYLCAAMPELDRKKLPDQGLSYTRFDARYVDDARVQNTDRFDARLL
jgi:hypothetical protein